jgi:hypothetical protein
MKNILYKALLIAVTLSSLSSCLKDDSLVLDPEKGSNVIEFANPASPSATGTPSPLYSFSYEATANPVLPITVSYSGPELVAPQDITVKIAIGDTTQINPYNRATTNNYVPLGAAGYTLSATEVVIKAGTSKASFNVLLKPSAFNFAASEVLALKIASASSGVISGNFGVILLNVSAKNKYDGVYAVTGTMVDVTSASLTHVNNALGSDAPMQYQLVTISATKCALYDDYVYGGYYAVIASGTAFSNYGGFSAIFEFDPTTDRVIAVTNRAGQPNPANTRGGRLDPTGDNSRVSATVFKVKYNMTQPSVVAAAPNVRTTWDETWTRLGAR